MTIVGPRRKVLTARNANKQSNVQHWPQVLLRLVQEYIGTASFLLFEVGGVVVSIVDIISDLLVAHELNTNGHTNWAIAVLVPILLSNVIYTVITVEHVRKNSNQFVFLSRLPRLIQYPVGFVFAQAFPFAAWILAVLTEMRMGRRSTSPTKRSVPQAAATANTELDDIVGKADNSRRMMEQFNEHTYRHLMLYVETVVESIPQVVVQLMAAASLGYTTPTQTFSQLLSIASIISKAHLLAHTLDNRVYWWKWAVVVHDIISLFYFFSTVLHPSPNATVLVPYFHVLVTESCYRVLYKMYVTSAVSLGCWVVAFTGILVCETNNWGELFLFMCCFVVCIPPAIILLECLKLSYIMMLFILLEPTGNSCKAIKFYFQFVEGAATVADKRARQLIALNQLEHHYTKRGNSSYLPTMAKERLNTVRSVLHASSNSSGDIEWSLAWHVFFKLSRMGYNIRTAKMIDWMVVGSFWVFISVNVVGSVVSIVFPLQHYFLELDGEGNFVQWICLWCLLMLLAVIVGQFFVSLRYIKALLATRWISSTHSSPCSDEVLRDVLREYHRPTIEEILVYEVPQTLIPYDLCYVISHLLVDGDIDLNSMSLEEWKKYRHPSQ